MRNRELIGVRDAYPSVGNLAPTVLSEEVIEEIESVAVGLGFLDVRRLRTSERGTANWFGSETGELVSQLLSDAACVTLGSDREIYTRRDR